eukprot:m.285415 g.285415  ORF g.285415 m.285415 type:complete len:211 (+) comp11368_c0_seq1:880-1512(+)
MPPPPPKPAPKPGKVTVFRALYPYTAAHADELTFEEGDLIYVSGKTDDGWLKATIAGKSGIIPGNYVEAANAESVDHPIHEACKRGNLPFLQECIANNVSVNGLDKAGSTPLHWASRGGHVDCVKMLLSQPRIQVNVQNKLGDTPLHGAAWKGHDEVITMLLEAGADRTIANNEGVLPYDIASSDEAGRLLQVRAQYNDYADEEDDPESD